MTEKMKNIKIEFIVKVGLIIVLMLCLLDMPYGYYQFVRISSFVGLGFLTYREYQEKNIGIFLIGAILFNPIIKLNLGRQVWQIVDATFSIVLLVSSFKKFQYLKPRN